MSLKGFRRPNGTRIDLYTDNSLTKANAPADAAAVKAKDDALSERIDRVNSTAEGLDARLSTLENGATGIISNVTETWLAEHVTPVGSAVLVDDSLTQSGDAADAKAVGDKITSVKNLCPTIFVDGESSENVDLKILGRNFAASDFTVDEYIDKTNGNVVSGTGCHLRVPVKEGSSILLDVPYLVFYNGDGDFISCIEYNSSSLPLGSIVTVPVNAVYMEISATRTADSYVIERANRMRTSFRATEAFLYYDELQIGNYNNDIENINSQISGIKEDASKHLKVSLAYDTIDSDEVDIFFWQKLGIRTGTQFEEAITKNATINQNGEVVDATGTYGFYIEVLVKPNSTISAKSAKYCFYDYYHNFISYVTPEVYEEITVPANAVYCAFIYTFTDTTHGYTLGKEYFSSFNTNQYVNKVNLYYDDLIVDLSDENVADMSNRMADDPNSDIGVFLSNKVISESNRMRHAFRVATFNIKGTGGNGKTRLGDIKKQLQKYGVDIIGFQEVYDPLGALSDGVFSETMESWHLKEFSDSVSFQTNARIVAATGDFNFVASSETKYNTQSNYGDRYFVKAEFELPMWKHKHWSEHMRVSVYDTQLEVGSSDTTRLAQASQLLSAIANDTNPFIIIVGDFNDFSPVSSTWEAIKSGGFSAALDDYSTPTSYRGYYDNIFFNDRISCLGTDVIPYSEDGSNISDHDLVFADLSFDYSHLIGLKLGLVNCHVSNPTTWLDNRQSEPVSFTIVPDDGYTLGTISCGQGDNDVTYDNGAVTKNGNTVTIIPNLVVGDAWINCTAS